MSCQLGSQLRKLTNSLGIWPEISSPSLSLFSALVTFPHPIHATAMRNGSMLAFSSLASSIHGYGSCPVALNF